MGGYEETGPTHAGFRFFNDGPSAAVRTDDGFTIVLIRKPGGTMSTQQFRSLGIEPREARIVIAKGVHSSRPAMEPIARETADLTIFQLSPPARAAVSARAERLLVANVK